MCQLWRVLCLGIGLCGDPNWTCKVNRASKRSSIPWVLQVNGEPKPILHEFYSEEAAKPGSALPSVRIHKRCVRSSWLSLPEGCFAGLFRGLVWLNPPPCAPIHGHRISDQRLQRHHRAKSLPVRFCVAWFTRKPGHGTGAASSF